MCSSLCKSYNPDLVTDRPFWQTAFILDVGITGRFRSNSTFIIEPRCIANFTGNVTIETTRMHSSRMRTARPLTVVPICMLGRGGGGGGPGWGWGCCPGGGGGGPVQGGMVLSRGVLSRGGRCCPGGWSCPEGSVVQGGGCVVQGGGVVHRLDRTTTPTPPPWDRATSPGQDHLHPDHVTYPMMHLVSHLPPVQWQNGRCLWKHNLCLLCYAGSKYMLFSRMCTTHWLTISGGVYAPLGRQPLGRHSLPPGRHVSRQTPPDRYLLQSDIPQGDTPKDIPTSQADNPLWIEWQTLVKTLPCRILRMRAVMAVPGLVLIHTTSFLSAKEIHWRLKFRVHISWHGLERMRQIWSFNMPPNSPIWICSRF